MAVVLGGKKLGFGENGFCLLVCVVFCIGWSHGAIELELRSIASPLQCRAANAYMEPEPTPPLVVTSGDYSVRNQWNKKAWFLGQDFEHAPSARQGDAIISDVGSGESGILCSCSDTFN